ncbi:MAG: heparinase II/III domain-containing protein, partial [Candidatus Fervidibacter sp.]|uniref:heparinase II/III domain-containing protein n=1 Tax=Candidatus Fervidibacter sp. TaxID=3100871 RepID=UPI00404AFF8C
WRCLQYGPHGGGHGHPDKLNFILYARGQLLAIDPGMARYGVPIHSGWYRTTLAHNTLAVDESNQKPAEGKCLAFGEEKGVNFVAAHAGDIYGGVTFVRAIALFDKDNIIVFDRVRCESERLLDISLHLRGKWSSFPEGESWTPPDKDGYRYMRDATIREVKDKTRVSVNAGNGWQVSVTLLADAPFDLITALGVGSHAEDRVPMLTVRRRSTSLSLIWGINLDGKALQVSWLPAWSMKGEIVNGTAIRVELPDGKVRSLVFNPEGTQLRVNLLDSKMWTAQGFFSVR